MKLFVLERRDLFRKGSWGVSVGFFFFLFLKKDLVSDMDPGAFPSMLDPCVSCKMNPGFPV